MKTRYIIILLGVVALLQGCNVYKAYQRPEVEVNGLYRDTVSVADTLCSDTVNMGNLPWREVMHQVSLWSITRAVCRSHYYDGFREIEEDDESESI